MTNGIIFCVCSTLVISVPQLVLESQSLWSAKAEEYDKTGKPVVGRDISHASGHHHERSVESSYSATQDGTMTKPWFSLEWKADELMDDRTGTPVDCSRAKTHEFQSRFSCEHKHVIFEEENHD